MSQTNATIKTLLDGYLTGVTNGDKAVQILSAYSNLILADSIDALTAQATGSYGIKAVFAPSGSPEVKVSVTTF